MSRLLIGLRCLSAGLAAVSPVFGRIDELPTSGEGFAYVAGVTPNVGECGDRNDECGDRNDDRGG
jgi:hypothetical protein